jgi:acetyl esterase
VIDPACATASMVENATGYMLTADSMRWMWQSYLGGAATDDPYLNPSLAEDLSGLPPALVITAEFDPLRDEGEAYAKALSDAGTPAKASRYDGQIHGFFSMHALAPQSAVALAEAAHSLRAAFAG